MKKVVLDPTLRSRLNGLSEQLEICDEQGRVVGHFLPPDLYRKLAYAAAEAACPLTKEELEERKKATGGRPLAEIWKSLGVR